MGKGAAQLGKLVKGRSRERTKDKKNKTRDDVEQKQEGADLKMSEEYEAVNKLADVQRLRLKRLQQQEMYNTRINKKLLLNIHRKFMRAEKVVRE